MCATITGVCHVETQVRLDCEAGVRVVHDVGFNCGVRFEQALICFGSCVVRIVMCALSSPFEFVSPFLLQTFFELIEIWFYGHVGSDGRG